MDDRFELYDLRVEVADCRGEMVCNHPPRGLLRATGRKPVVPPGPDLPALPPCRHPAPSPGEAAGHGSSRLDDPTDTDIACPDPHCGAVFRISRIGRSTFRHGDVTRVPLEPPEHDRPRDGGRGGVGP